MSVSSNSLGNACVPVADFNDLYKLNMLCDCITKNQTNRITNNTPIIKCNYIYKTEENERIAIKSIVDSDLRNKYKRTINLCKIKKSRLKLSRKEIRKLNIEKQIACNSRLALEANRNLNNHSVEPFQLKYVLRELGVTNITLHNYVKMFSGEIKFISDCNNIKALRGEDIDKIKLRIRPWLFAAGNFKTRKFISIGKLTETFTGSSKQNNRLIAWLRQKLKANISQCEVLMQNKNIALDSTLPSSVIDKQIILKKISSNKLNKLKRKLKQYPLYKFLMLIMENSITHRYMLPYYGEYKDEIDRLKEKWINKNK